MMPLTTLARLKAALEISSTEVDTPLRRLISGVSMQIEGWLGRHILTEARTEQYTLGALQRMVFLRGYPVVSVASIKDSPQRDFSTAATLDASQYYVEQERGVVTLDKWYPNGWPGGLQVVYTGGMATSLVRMVVEGVPSGTYTASEVVNGSNFEGVGTFVSQTASSLTFDVSSGSFAVGDTITGATSAKTTVVTALTTEPLIHRFPEIELAAIEQLRWKWNQRSSGGRTSISLNGVSVSVESGDLTDSVKAMLSRHRRVVSPRR